MSLPREVLQSSAVSAARRLRASGDYILSKDNWRIGITGLLAQSLGLVPFKNVFWSSRRNPGNKFYYNCMEVNEDVDPNQPWSLKYRYTGYMNTTKSGHSCLAWSDLDLHWEFPEGDLERDGCRSMAVYPDSDPAKGQALATTPRCHLARSMLRTTPGCRQLSPSCQEVGWGWVTDWTLLTLIWCCQ